MLSRFLIAFLPRSERLLISCLQSPSAVILESRKLKSVNAYTFTPFYLPWSDGTRCHDLSFLKVKFQASFFTPLSLSSRGSLVPLHFLPWEWYHLHIWGCWWFINLHDSSNPSFCTVYSAQKLNIQGDNIRVCHTLFPIWTSQLLHVWF